MHLELSWNFDDKVTVFTIPELSIQMTFPCRPHKAKTAHYEGEHIPHHTGGSREARINRISHLNYSCQLCEQIEEKVCTVM